jgi:hypothetical protein
VLQAFYTIRSERQLMEQLDYNTNRPNFCLAGDSQTPPVVSRYGELSIREEGDGFAQDYPHRLDR